MLRVVFSGGGSLRSVTSPSEKEVLSGCPYYGENLVIVVSPVSNSTVCRVPVGINEYPLLTAGIVQHVVINSCAFPASCITGSTVVHPKEILTISVFALWIVRIIDQIEYYLANLGGRCHIGFLHRVKFVAGRAASFHCRWRIFVAFPVLGTEFGEPKRIKPGGWVECVLARVGSSCQTEWIFAEVSARFGVVVSLVVVVVSGFGVVVLAGEAEWAVDCPGAGGDGGSPDGVLGVPGGLAVWVDQVGWGSDEVANDGVETSVDFGLGCPDEPGSVGLGCRDEDVWSLYASRIPTYPPDLLLRR